jgi:PKHD-type hydroxylase
MHHSLRKNPDLAGIATEISVFTPDECETIISLALQKEEVDTLVFTTNGLKKNTSIRSAKQYLMDESAFPGLYAHIRKVFSVSNYVKFQYDAISVQVMRYRDGDFYASHTDWSINKSRRKLSMSIQLSPPDDYTGGDVYIHAGPESTAITREQGCATVWPSWTLHEVAPITSGERWALISWAEGKPFV